MIWVFACYVLIGLVAVKVIPFIWVSICTIREDARNRKNGSDGK